MNDIQPLLNLEFMLHQLGYRFPGFIVQEDHSPVKSLEFVPNLRIKSVDMKVTPVGSDVVPTLLSSRHDTIKYFIFIG